MTEVSENGSTPAELDDLDSRAGTDSDVELFGAASTVLGILGFLTLLRTADQRARTPARILLLWITATAESNGAILTGAMAIKKSRAVGRPSRGVLLASVGTALGSLSLILNFNWLRTRRPV